MSEQSDSGSRDTGLGFTGPMSGRRDYEVLELLPGSGGQGFVFRARLCSDRLGPGLRGREVALKQLIAGSVGHDDLPDIQRRMAARTHPNLARQLEVFVGPAVGGEAGEPGFGAEDAGGDDLTYVAALWVPGLTIDLAALDAPLAEVLRWVRQVGTAVDFLHSPQHHDGGMLHRDITPRNVVIDPAGNALLIDPGLACPVGGANPRTPHGSSGYIPPECQRDPLAGGPAGDRWQVGAWPTG
jgi:serine/threonine protein kinase